MAHIFGDKHYLHMSNILSSPSHIKRRDKYMYFVIRQQGTDYRMLLVMSAYSWVISIYLSSSGIIALLISRPRCYRKPAVEKELISYGKPIAIPWYSKISTYCPSAIKWTYSHPTCINISRAGVQSYTEFYLSVHSTNTAFYR